MLLSLACALSLSVGPVAIQGGSSPAELLEGLSFRGRPSSCEWSVDGVSEATPAFTTEAGLECPVATSEAFVEAAAALKQGASAAVRVRACRGTAGGDRSAQMQVARADHAAQAAERGTLAARQPTN